MAKREEVEEPIFGVFTDLFEAELTPPTWVVEDMLPVGLVFVGAPPKSGKSTLTMALAALVAGFKCKALPPFMSKVPMPGRVMAFSYEATAGELRHMVEIGLRVSGQADESIIICDDPWQFRLDDENGLERLLGWLDERKPKLTLLDPLRDFHAGEEKDSGGMNRLLRPLRDWAVKHDASIVIVHHTKKPDAEKTTYDANDLRGSGAIFGIADGVLMLTPRDSGHVTVRATFKRAKGWERTIRVSAYDYTAPAAEAMSDVDTKVLSALKAGIEDMEELEAQLHLGKTKLNESLQKLARNGLIVQQGFWWKPFIGENDGESGRVGVVVPVSRAQRGPTGEVPSPARKGAGDGADDSRGGARRGGPRPSVPLPAKRSDVGQLGNRQRGKVTP